METIVLGTPDAEISIGALAQRLGPKGAEVRDAQGRVIAIVMPQSKIKWPESFGKEVVMGRDPRLAKEGGRGITTQQLFEKLNAIPLPPKQS